MSQVIIGMDPHKRSATIEVMTADESVAGGGRYGTDAAGLAAMLAAVRQWPDRKTDATDAHAIALAATRMKGLRPVTGDARLEVLRVLADRRRALGEDHTRMICQLHQQGHRSVVSTAGLDRLGAG